MNRNDPLSPEERDLAGRLARLGGPREPSAALDAAILAAARAAVAPQSADALAEPSAPVPLPAVTAAAAPGSEPETRAGATVVSLAAAAKPKPKPRPRWPLGLSLAASLALAATIGLRVLDTPDGGNFDTAAAESAQRLESADAAADSVTEAVMIEAPLQRTAPPPPPPLESAPAAGASADVRQFAADDNASGDVYEPKEARAAAEALAPSPLPPPAPPAPPAPVAAAPALSPLPAAPAARSANAFQDRESAERRQLGAGTRPREAKISDEEAGNLDKIEITGSRIRTDGRADAAAPAFEISRDTDAAAQKALNEEYDSQPPLSADAPEVRQAWLQRIRRLVAEGKTEAARESLAEFRRRYPTAELPEDLKKLAATLPPPTP